MQQFGQAPVQEAEDADNTFTVPNSTRYRLPSATYAIEPDATAASYFFALPLVTSGSLRLELWATASPYSGGTIQGYILGSYRFSQVLGPNQ